MKRITSILIMVLIASFVYSEQPKTATMDSTLVSNLRSAVTNGSPNYDEVMDFYYDKINPGSSDYEEGEGDDWRENRADYEPIKWTNNYTREILWEYWYDPFGADGYNVRPHMAICQDGGFAVTGYYIIEDGMGGWLEWQGYVLKTDSNGIFLWADKDTLDFMGENESRAIVETSDGSIINGGDGYMIKRDGNGNRLWEQIIYGGIGAMCNTNDGNIIITGGTQTGEFLLRKIDEDGNEIWNKDFMMGTNWTSGKCIIQTSDEGFVITGSVSDEMSNSDILIIKTNSLGDTLWTYRKDGCGDWDQGNWILENSENNLLVCGLLYNQQSTGFIGLYNLEGDILSEYSGNQTIGYEQFYAIDIPEDNSFLITAGITGMDVYKCDYNYNIEWIDDDEEIINPYYQKLSENEYIFYFNGVQLMKWEGELVRIKEDIISVHKTKLKCYPNPFNPEIMISFDLPKYTGNSQINIYNSNGQRVKQYKLIENYSSVVWNGIDKNGSRVSSGVYFVTLNSNGKTLAFKKITMIK